MNITAGKCHIVNPRVFFHPAKKLVMGDPLEHQNSGHVALVARVRGGDDLAVLELYEITMRQRGRVVKQIGHQDAEDLMQDVFVAVLTAIRAGKLREPLKLVGFIQQTARNKTARAILERQEVRGVTTECPVDVASREISPEQSAIEHESETHAIAALGRLEPRDRHVMERVYVQEEPLRSVATELGLKAFTAHKIRWRAERRYTHHHGLVLAAPRRRLMARITYAAVANRAAIL